MQDKAELFRINKDKIEQIQTMCDDLSDFEAGFIIGINDWLHEKGSLSEKQQSVLDRIYREKFERKRRPRW